MLAAVDRDLVRAIDFGMFSWLVVPLLRALKWVNSYVGNYGWSIILLTVLINLVMFPLRHKSVVSMRKMQEVQPEVKAIQDRYAKLKMSDPARQKMNTELMELYSERGVNPGQRLRADAPDAAGAVRVLLDAVGRDRAARRAVHRLDPRPLGARSAATSRRSLMGITMFVQQRMTPSTADPVQQKMMMFMPLMFTAMFLWAPSGLVIYWTVSNVWGIGQQMITNRLIGPTALRTVRPPASGDGGVKSVGGGKTDQAQERSASDELHEKRRRLRQERPRRDGTDARRRRSSTRRTAIRVEITGDGGEVLLQAQGRGARRAAADRQHRLPPRARTTTAASSSIAWATAAARTTS